jgi:hypothetical protein
MRMTAERLWEIKCAVNIAQSDALKKFVIELLLENQYLKSPQFLEDERAEFKTSLDALKKVIAEDDPFEKWRGQCEAGLYVAKGRTNPKPITQQLTVARAREEIEKLKNIIPVLEKSGTVNIKNPDSKKQDIVMNAERARALIEKLQTFIKQQGELDANRSTTREPTTG